MDIAAIVKELVFTGGSLIVPGVGKFSINRMPAEMDISAKIITPPSRIINFDGLKTRDDGKLASLLAERYSLNHHEAAAAVNRWVKSLKEEMAVQGRAVITSFGTLEPGQKGISFRDDPFIMYSSLLPSVSFRTAKREEPQPAERPREKLTIPSDPKRRKVLVPVLITAIAVVAVTAFFLSGFHREIFKGSGTAAGTSDAENQKIVFGKPPEYNDSLTETISDNIDRSTLKENALSYEEPQPVSPQETAVEEVITTATAAAEQETPDAVSGYHIIAGAYMVPDNAEKQKQILENRGFKSIILPPQGSYYMVSLGSYRTLEQVTDVTNSLRDELEIPLWVKKI